MEATLHYPYEYAYVDNLNTSNRMADDPLREALRSFTASDLERDISSEVWDFADAQHFGVKDVLEDDVARAALFKLRAYQRRGGRGKLERSERQEWDWATEDLKKSKRYLELRRRMPDLLDFTLRLRGMPRRSARPTVRRTPTPYLDRMALALEVPMPEETYGEVVALPPILGGFRDGCIWIEVEPWVPLKTVKAYYQSLLDSLGSRPREFLKETSLDVYLWARRRREARPNETWREAMAAWNATGHPKKYKHPSNFHKDYHRFHEAVEDARRQIHDLRAAATGLEFAEATRIAGPRGVRVTRKSQPARKSPPQ